MVDDTSRRRLHQVAKRGGAVSAGALVVMLAGGSFAVASGSGENPTGVVTGAASDLTSTVKIPTAVPSGGLSVPQPAPLPAPVNDVVTTVTQLTGPVGNTLNETVKTLTGQPSTPPTNGGPPTTTPPVVTKPQPGDSGTDTHAPAAVTHPAAAAGRDAANPTRPAGTAARQRADAAPGTTGSFAEQQTNASITPALSPRSRESVLPAPGLGRHGVPGVLVVIATAGLAALGASHLGIWYNRRVVTTA